MIRGRMQTLSDSASGRASSSIHENPNGIKTFSPASSILSLQKASDFSSWLRKEIYEQPEAIRAAVSRRQLDDGADGRIE